MKATTKKILAGAAGVISFVFLLGAVCETMTATVIVKLVSLGVFVGASRFIDEEKAPNTEA